MSYTGSIDSTYKGKYSTTAGTITGTRECITLLTSNALTVCDSTGSTMCVRAAELLIQYLRLNEGTTDCYETGARLIPDPLTHFDVEFTVLGDVDNAGSVVAQSASSSTKELHVFTDGGGFGVICGNGPIKYFSTIMSAGTYRVVNDGVNYTLFKSGLLVETVTANIGTLVDPTATFTIAARHGGSLGSYGYLYGGVIANVIIRDDLGVITNKYPINDNTNVILDTIGGQDGSIINGTADDWGLFNEQPTLWKGQDLTVPPWDSIDQELLK